MKARISILTITAALAISGLAAQPGGAAIPWDASMGSAGARTAERSLAVVREAYAWKDYVHTSSSVRNVYRDALDRRGGAGSLARQVGGLSLYAYVPGGASLDVAKAIVAAGKSTPVPTRITQSAQRADFRYVR